MPSPFLVFNQTMNNEFAKKRIGFQIFFRRPLALVCAVFLVSSILGFVFCLAVKFVLAISFTLGIIVCAAMCSSKKIKKRSFVGIAATLAAGVLALLLSFLYFDVYYTSGQQYVGSECEISGIVNERLYSGSYSEGYFVTVKRINGEKVFYNAILDCEYISDLQPGYEFFATVEAEELGYSDTNASDKRSQIADGYILRFVSDDEFDYDILAEDVYTFRGWLSAINRSVSLRLSMLVGGDEGILSAALLMGNTDRLPINVSRDFSRSGTTHILALSGMHMTVIIGFFDWLLTKIRVNRYVRSVLLILLSFFYLAITGFSPSATRSVIMLTLVYLSFILASTTDMTTSLFLSVSLIILLSPRSVADSGLWLSFSAVLGIIICSMVIEALFNKIDRHRRERAVDSKAPVGFLRKISRGCVNAVAISVAANIGVIFTVWLCYGETSVFSVPASVLMSPISSILLASSLGTTLIKLLGGGARILKIPIGICRISAKLMIEISEYFADFDGAVISLRFAYAGIIIVSMTLIILIMIMIKLKHKWTIILPPIAATIAFVMCTTVYTDSNVGLSQMTYLCEGENETILLTSERDSVIIDISRGGVAGVREALDIASEQGVCEVTAFALTHYHQKHISTVYKLCSSEHVGELWLPRPINEKEFGIMMSIINCAEALDVACVVYEGELEIFNGITAKISRDYIKRSTHPTITLEINAPDGNIVYVGSSAMEGKLNESINNAVSGADKIILGAHGPVLKTIYSFSEYNENLDTVLFSTDDSISYYRYGENKDILSNAIILRSAERYNLVFGEN